MSQSSADRYRDSGFFVVRTPVLPYDEFARASDDLRAAGCADEEGFSSALARDRATVHGRLRDRLRNDRIREALFLASPSLDEAVDRWLAGTRAEEDHGVARAVAKYVQRMSVRCTPFGLFAGGALGTVADRTRVELGTAASIRRHTRLDMGYLTGLVEKLTQDPAVRSVVRWFPNSSLYRQGDQVRYAEGRQGSSGRSYFLVSARADEALSSVLEAAEDGARRDDLAGGLVREDVSREEAREYVDELIESQILVPELAPAITGPDTLDDLLAQLATTEPARDVRRVLARVRADLVDLDAAKSDTSPRRYRELAEELSRLPGEVSVDRLFQVDVTKRATRATLGRRDVDLLARGAWILHGLFGARRDGLEGFREAFRRRYGDREVPLVEALDEESGIGLARAETPAADASPLLRGLLFPSPTEERAVEADAFTGFLLRRLADVRAEGKPELTLSEDELAPYRKTDVLPLPEAFQVMGSVFRDHVFVHSVSGPSGACLLGRFCHGDPALRECVEAHVRAEESLHPDKVYFEIAHHPEGRVGNVLARPLLRGHELEFLGRSGASPDRKLRVSDLTLSLRGDRLVLRSRTLDREVVPRLTTAHNTTYRALPIYAFLSALQTQGLTSGISWRWGLLAGQPFLPRVRCGDIVLSPATWNVAPEEVRELARRDPAEAFRTVRMWRARRGLPRLVGLVEGDNVLPVDLDHCVSVDAFLHAIQGRERVELQELPADLDALVARGPEGRFTNEVVVPFVARAEAPAVPADGDSRTSREPSGEPVRPPAGPSRAEEMVSCFPPGSEWLYAKIYLGAATADRVLVEAVRPLTASLEAEGLVDRWFFLRYADPDWHLRIRLHGEPSALLGRVAPALLRSLDPWVRGGLVWRIQHDTYERELDRYGGPEGIEPCEAVFDADSRAVLEILDVAERSGDADLPWRATLLGLHLLLEDFGLDEVDRFLLVQDLAEAYRREFSIEGDARKRLLDRYREVRRTVDSILGEGDGDAGLLACEPALRDRSRRIRPHAAQLRRRAEEGRLGATFPELVRSILHMHTNRMFRSAARAQEMVAYLFLARGYDSLLARRGIKGKARLTSRDRS